METLKLNNANLVELTNDELVNIDGGGLLPYIFAFGLYLASEWDDFSQGVSDGYNS